MDKKGIFISPHNLSQAPQYLPNQDVEGVESGEGETTLVDLPGLSRTDMYRALFEACADVLRLACEEIENGEMDERGAVSVQLAVSRTLEQGIDG